jgi:AraC family transcriptional regulator
VVALFTGAPGIGPLKVYPVAEDYMLENKLTRKGGVIEIYEIFDKRAMQTTYIWPIAN